MRERSGRQDVPEYRLAEQEDRVRAANLARLSPANATNESGGESGDTVWSVKGGVGGGRGAYLIAQRREEVR